MSIQLTQEQLDSYRRDGFLVVEGLLEQDEVEGLRTRLREYTHGGRSQERLQVQIEPRVQRGELHVDAPGDGIRKIDGLVESDDRFHALGSNANIVSVLEQIVGPDIKMFRNAALLKPPEVGSAKGMHQDSPYWPIEPMDLCSCWFAFDDATEENGCMAAIPGSHKRGPQPHINVTDDFVVDPDYYEQADMQLAPVKAGGGLFFHSLLLHYTAPNRSDSWRRAIALSYMSARSKYTRDGEGPVYHHIQGRTFDGCVR